MGTDRWNPTSSKQGSADPSAATNPLASELEEALRLRQDADARVQSLDEELRQTREAARMLQSRLRGEADKLAQSQAELRLRMNEVRYRLGDALVRASQSPLDLILAPVRVARLIAEGWRNRRERRMLKENAVQRADRIAPLRQSRTEPTRECGAGVAMAPGESATILPRTPKLSVKAATILDEFSHACFQPECYLLSITPDGWEESLQAERPDLLFVESASQLEARGWWRRGGGARVADAWPLAVLVRSCKSYGIPTVFWNKEDPPGFEHFIGVASLFDVVFTTDADCLPRYRRHLGHDRVYPLPFAAQPAIHNPIGSRQDRVARFCFAGSYYAQRHEDRRIEADLLLKPALERGLHIYDRMHGRPHGDAYRFPPEYEPVIRPALSYDQMVEVYKHYLAFLNVNSVANSPTTFSRRVFELLACGTPVVSTYARGIENLFGHDCVVMAKSREEAAVAMDRLLEDKDYREKLAVLGQRRVFADHTYEKRLDLILAKIGKPVERARRRVSVIALAFSRNDLTSILANYRRQHYPEKELILLVADGTLDLDGIRRRLASEPEMNVFEAPETGLWGECLQFGLDRGRSEFITCFANEACYAEHYLTDLMTAFLYADAGIVGKCTHYAYLKDRRCLLVRRPGKEHQFVRSLANSAMIARRDALEKIRSAEGLVHDAARFQQYCVEHSIRMYATDRFNHVLYSGQLRRGARPQVSDEEFLRGCVIVDYTDDPAAHVIV